MESKDVGKNDLITDLERHVKWLNYHVTARVWEYSEDVADALDEMTQMLQALRRRVNE